jgi:hypothetical protein
MADVRVPAHVDIGERAVEARSSAHISLTGCIATIGIGHMVAWRPTRPSVASVYPGTTC